VRNSCNSGMYSCSTSHCRLFLLLARYVPNVAKRSILDQCKKKYILRTDRPTTDLSFGLYWGNFKWPYLHEGSYDPLHVWFYGGVFGVGGSNGAISGFAKSKMAARPPSWKIQMAISPRRIVRFHSVFGSMNRMGFSGSADRMALIPF